MTTQTRNRLLTIIFLLLVTLLVSELSYYFFNRQSSSQPTPSFQPTPVITSPTPTPSLNPSNPTTTINQNTIDELIKLIPKPYTYISGLTFKLTLQGTLIKKTNNSLVIIKPNYKPLTIDFLPQHLKILTVQPSTITSPSNNLNNLQLNKLTTINIIIKLTNKPVVADININQL